MRIDRREDQGSGAIEPVLPRAQHCRRNILGLRGRAVEAGDSASIYQIGVERIGSDVAVFLDAYRVPVAKGDGAIVAAAGDTNAAAFLLSAVHPVGKLIVGNDVVELRGGLVVPRTPGTPLFTLIVAPWSLPRAMMAGFSGFSQIV